MAEYKITPEFADNIVNFISGRTGFGMSVCNEQGVIIADNIAKGRIGKVHNGAQKIMQGLIDEYGVTAEEAAQNANVKEGFNCAIIVNDQRIGTFGIASKIEVAKPLAYVAATVVAYRIQEEMQKQAVAAVVETVSDNVQQAAAAVEEISASSQELAATTDNVVQLSQGSAQKVKDTEKILDMSRSIATQTKLLSLNASIEAARAGIHGRGFAVVAQEMQKLAQNSADATEKINIILRDIQLAIQKVIEGINQSAAISNEQARAMQDIIQMVESVQTSTAQLVTIFNEKG